MWANTSGGGMALGFPDTLLTPMGPVLVPVPYPNFASTPLGAPPIDNIIIAGAPAHNMGTVIPTSDGANPGVTGVASGMAGGPATPTTGAETVVFGGMPATRLTGTTLQNGGNADGSYVVPSQTVLLLLAP
jgi:hypothetical protein